MDPQTPTEPPPPAYELEYNFDRKISEALERSLTIANQAQQSGSLPAGNEDEWEEWDEARFEAAAALAREREQRQIERSRPSISHYSSEKEPMAIRNSWHPNHGSGEASSSTSGPAVQPKGPRRLPSRPPTKERPSWYSEAQLVASNASGSSQNSQVAPPHLVHHLPPEENVPNEPLPPFTPVGPSLEGPPFEEVVRQPRRLPSVLNIDSPPQSPLDSVESDSPPDPPPPPESSSQRRYGQRYRSTSPHQSLAPSIPPPIPPPVPPAIPQTSPNPGLSLGPPPMRFDPSVAYAKPLNPHGFSTEAEPVHASAFYNSAVSSHVGSAQASKKALPLRKDTSSSSYSNRSEVTVVSPTLHGAPTPNHPPFTMRNQATLPNSQTVDPQPPPQQAQRIAHSFYGHPYLGTASGVPTPTPSPTPTPPPPHRLPPPNNHSGRFVR